MRAPSSFFLSLLLGVSPLDTGHFAAAAEPAAAASPSPAPVAPSADSAGPPVFSSASFRAVAPPGYAPAEGELRPPLVALYVKRLFEGEAALQVEYYAEAELPRETFLRQLSAEPGRVRRARLKAARGSFEVYEGIEVETLTRRIGPGDPYLDALGASVEPPRLSLVESRRFPVGGEAYRLYRCRKRGAWRLLRGYRRRRARGEELAAFRARELTPSARLVLAACFGPGAALAMDTGAELADAPKPSLYRLRLMARDEWAYGAARRVERELVHLRDAPGGTLAVRLRAPKRAYGRERAAAARFLEGLQVTAR